MYKISYHHKIPDDLTKITAAEKKTIRKAIENKLMVEPELFGKPLRFSLRGLRSMRVGNYRVVFQLTIKEVFVVLIEHRSKVYQSIENRI